MKPPTKDKDEEQEEIEIEVVLWEDLTAEEKAEITWGTKTKP